MMKGIVEAYEASGAGMGSCLDDSPQQLYRLEEAERSVRAII